MATKRGLYRPVPENKVVQKKNRKPLAQGRLVNNGAKPQQSDEEAFHKLDEERLLSSPRSRLQSRVTKPAVIDKHRLTPRRATPQKCEKKLVVASEPSHSLDLSDSDMDHEEKISKVSVDQMKYHVEQGSILVVDVPHQSLDFNRSDVDTSMAYAMSPVKVVCHSPRVRVGSAARSWRTPVDIMPRIRIPPDSPQTHCDDNGLPSIAEPGTGLLETQEDGAAPLNSSISAAVVSGPKTPVQHLFVTPVGFPQPNFDDSLRPQSPQDDASLSDDQMSVISNISNTSSLREVLGNSSKNPPSANLKKSGQNKKGVKVSSRYLQSASKYKKSTKTKDNNLKQSSASRSSVQSRKGSRRSEEQKQVESSPCTQQTPAPSQQQHSASGKTSTPTHDEVSFLHNIDASAISSENTSTMNPYALAGIDLSYNPPIKKITKEQSKVSELELDIAYARYLQWLYLDPKAKKTLNDQQKCAMGQLNSLWEEVEDLRERKAHLKSELQQLNNAYLLDEQLDLQSCGLSPVVGKLPELTSAHRLSAQALDTTRHQIPAKGVHLPADQETYQENLIRALNDSERQLGELTLMTRTHTPKVTEVSHALELLEKAVDEESQFMKDCQKLISYVNSLTTTETSLLIQAIQAPQEYHKRDRQNVSTDT